MSGAPQHGHRLPIPDGCTTTVDFQGSAVSAGDARPLTSFGTLSVEIGIQGVSCSGPTCRNGAMFFDHFIELPLCGCPLREDSDGIAVLPAQFEAGVHIDTDDCGCLRTGNRAANRNKLTDVPVELFPFRQQWRLHSEGARTKSVALRKRRSVRYRFPQCARRGFGCRQFGILTTGDAARQRSTQK